MGQATDQITVELKRPDSSHSWGIYYAVLPNGPEILKVHQESPAFGRLKSGQVIKRINGQSVLRLTREEISELMNIDEEDLIIDLEVPERHSRNVNVFGTEYSRRSVEPINLRRRQSDVPLIQSDSLRKNSTLNEAAQRKSSTIQIHNTAPNVLHEFERIHRERKASRELTLSQFELARMQRCMSMDRPVLTKKLSLTPQTQQLPQPNRWAPLPPRGAPRPPLNVTSTGDNMSNLPIKPPGMLFKPNAAEKQPDVDVQEIETVSCEAPAGDPMSGLRYMGVRIPSRSFMTLAALVGLDPSGANFQSQGTTMNTEARRTSLDVRSKANETWQISEQERASCEHAPSNQDGVHLSPIIF